jgi:hypothetical protein
VTAIPIVQSNATQILPSYVYAEYSDDDDIQAFVAAQNSLAQGYLDWFNGTPFAAYTQPGISGPLLDWVGNSLYGIPRPVIGSSSTFRAGAISTFAINTIPVGAEIVTTSGQAQAVSDDMYKRVLTWIFYRGDGKIPSIDWLLRRFSRFLYGVNGTDIQYPLVAGSTLPTIKVVSSAFTVTVPNNSAGQTLQALVANGALPLPFENTFTVTLH